tara:strand:+ start:439 stop:897 length:459 start_codon:yes stop_codon:yes gene_type:complete
MTKIVSNKFYTKTEDLIFLKHENYKSQLTLKKKTAKQKIEKLEKSIARQKKHLAFQNLKLAELSQAKQFYESDIQEVDTEYSYRKKIVSLQKKYDFLSVEWGGDEDVYTTWIYGNFKEDDLNDPYHDNHYCDTYEEAYARCLEYIELETGEL